MAVTGLIDERALDTSSYIFELKPCPECDSTVAIAITSDIHGKIPRRDTTRTVSGLVGISAEIGLTQVRGGGLLPEKKKQLEGKVWRYPKRYGGVPMGLMLRWRGQIGEFMFPPTGKTCDKRLRIETNSFNPKFNSNMDKGSLTN